MAGQSKKIRRKTYRALFDGKKGQKSNVLVSSAVGSFENIWQPLVLHLLLFFSLKSRFSEKNKRIWPVQNKMRKRQI